MPYATGSERTSKPESKHPSLRIKTKVKKRGS